MSLGLSCLVNSGLGLESHVISSVSVLGPLPRSGALRVSGSTSFFLELRPVSAPYNSLTSAIPQTPPRAADSTSTILPHVLLGPQCGISWGLRRRMWKQSSELWDSLLQRALQSAPTRPDSDDTLDNI